MKLFFAVTRSPTGRAHVHRLPKHHVMQNSTIDQLKEHARELLGPGVEGVFICPSRDAKLLLMMNMLDSLWELSNGEHCTFGDMICAMMAEAIDHRSRYGQ